METKKFIWIGLFIGSILGCAIGSMLDHGNILGLWSFILGTAGSILGIWGGYKLGNL